MEDVERWPEFAPQFKSIKRTEDGPLAMDTTWRITPHGFFGADWTVTALETDRSFTWESDMLPGLHLIAGHVIEPQESGVDVTLSLESKGPTATLMWPILGRIFRRNIRQEADGLKEYCEER